MKALNLVSLSLTLAGAAVVAIGAASPAQALTLVTNRSALAGNDFIDWGTLGPRSTVVFNPFTINSNGGLSTNVSQTGGSFERRNQDTNWNGNFAPGDALLWTRGTNGPISMTFATGISGGGLQIQSFSYGAFTATIEAFDAGNVSLGSFNLAGNSSGNRNNSAIFIGVTSSTANISRLVFGVPTASFLPQDFAVNRFDLVTSNNNGTAVPVPPQFLATAVGAGLSALKLRKGKKDAGLVEA
jgi:hypothetical protein